MLSEGAIAKIRRLLPFGSQAKQEPVVTGVPARWTGYRDFEVSKVVIECDVATSLYLVPCDGEPLPEFLPGEKVNVRIQHPDDGTMAGDYFLSDRPGTGYYRITVARDPSEQLDDASARHIRFLRSEVRRGDKVQLEPPSGDFFLDPVALVDERPVVFIAGGTGMIPLLSMAKTMIDYGVLNHIYFLLVTQNSSTHILGDEVQMMIADKDFTQTLRVYESPLSSDVENWKCDETGSLTLSMLTKWAPVQQADFYCCGTDSFIDSVRSMLNQLEIPQSRTRFHILDRLIPNALTSHV